MPAGGIVAAAIPAVASLIGDSMAQSGQQATNAMNLNEIKQEENWMSDMSDTAMQRRVTDLKQAGLNPLLAVGQGGASTPGIGQIPMQNPNLAYSALGTQMGNAVQSGQNEMSTQAQVNLNSAQARKANADAANTEARNPYSAAQAKAETDNLVSTKSLIDNQAYDMATKYYMDNVTWQNMVNNPKLFADMQNMQENIMRYNMNAAKYGQPALENDAAFNSKYPWFGALLRSQAIPQVTGGVRNLASLEFGGL